MDVLNVIKGRCYEQVSASVCRSTRAVPQETVEQICCTQSQMKWCLYIILLALVIIQGTVLYETCLFINTHTHTLNSVYLIAIATADLGSADNLTNMCLDGGARIKTTQETQEWFETRTLLL